MSNKFGILMPPDAPPMLRMNREGYVIVCLCRCDAPQCVAQHAAVDALLEQGYTLILGKNSDETRE